MREFSQNSEERQDIKELLIQFDNLWKGKTASYIDEESFERIIEYFESEENFIKARIAVDIAIERYPYSGTLLVKKLIFYSPKGVMMKLCNCWNRHPFSTAATWTFTF